jgi:lambda repressor-like predicted transcriptional regulator/biotin operon repressor
MRNREQQRATVVAAYLAGTSVAKLAQDLTLPESTIYRWLTQAGIRSGKTGRPRTYTDAQATQWAEWYVRVPMSLEEIAEQSGVSKSVVSAAIQSTGVRLRSRGVVADRARRLTHAVPEILDAYRAGGVTVGELATRYRVSEEQITKLLRADGQEIIRGPRRKEWPVDEWVAAHKDGVSLRQIARDSGAGNATVWRLVNAELKAESGKQAGAS